MSDDEETSSSSSSSFEYSFYDSSLPTALAVALSRGDNLDQIKAFFSSSASDGNNSNQQQPENSTVQSSSEEQQQPSDERKGCRACSIETDGEGALLCAAWYGHLEAVKWLIEGCGVSATDARDPYDGMGPFLKACKRGHTGVVQWLVETGGVSSNESISFGASHDISGLELATCYGHNVECVKWLVENGGCPTLADAGRALKWPAMQEGQIEVVKYLVAAKPECIHWVDEEGNTALMGAVQQSNFEAVQWLIQEGAADVKHKNSRGDTPLLYAIEHQYVEVVKWLVQHAGGVVDEKVANGDNALQCAASGGCWEIVWWLIEKGGCSADCLDGNCRTVMARAVAYGHFEIVKGLLEEGWSSMDETNCWGTHPQLCSWVEERKLLFCTTGWSVSQHKRFPKKFRMFCGVALWCLSCSGVKGRSGGGGGITVVLIPVEVAGVMFCFWHGDLFAPTYNTEPWGCGVLLIDGVLLRHGTKWGPDTATICFAN